VAPDNPARRGAAHLKFNSPLDRLARTKKFCKNFLIRSPEGVVQHGRE
jgi:hypothetical protein